MSETLVSRADLARELACAKSTITEMIRLGLPTSGGKLDRAAALEWIINNRTGNRGGWSAEAHGRASIAERAEALLNGETVTPASDEAVAAWRQLLDRIVRESIRVPEIALGLGLRDPAVILAIQDAFLLLLFEFAGPYGAAAYDWAREDIPQTEPDLKALAKRYGVRLLKKHEEAADDLSSRLSLLLCAPAEGGRQ